MKRQRRKKKNEEGREQPPKTRSYQEELRDIIPCYIFLQGHLNVPYFYDIVYSYYYYYYYYPFEACISWITLTQYYMYLVGLFPDLALLFQLSS